MKTQLLARHIANACERRIEAIHENCERMAALIVKREPSEGRPYKDKIVGHLWWKRTVVVDYGEQTYTQAQADFDYAAGIERYSPLSFYGADLNKLERLQALALHKRPDTPMEIEGDDLDMIAKYLTSFASSEEARI